MSPQVQALHEEMVRLHAQRVNSLPEFCWKVEHHGTSDTKLWNKVRISKEEFLYLLDFGPKRSTYFHNGQATIHIP